jgi:hypothetical protein
MWDDIAHEAAICHNPLIHNLTENRKTLQILNRSTHERVMFLPKYKEKQFFYGRKIWTEGVFVTQLYSNAGISV